MEARKLNRVVIKEEIFSLTKDTFEAIILGQLIYWQERVKDFDKFLIEESERKKNNGEEDVNIVLQNGWIYKSSKQLIEECMLTISEVTMRKYLKILEDKGFIESRSNPIKKWDKVLQYRVNLALVIQKIQELGYNGLSDYNLMVNRDLDDEENNLATNLENLVTKQNNLAAIPYTNIKDNNKDKKEDTKKDDLFEDCWKSYLRKGSKAESKKEWAKLTDEEKQQVKEHIPYYVSSQSKKTFQKDFERYLKKKIFNNVVYKGNSTLYDPEQMNEAGEYRPKLDGFNMIWLEGEKCYMTPFEFSMLNDGYTKDNRPSSAVVMHNGIKYQWDVELKDWRKL